MTHQNGINLLLPQILGRLMQQLRNIAKMEKFGKVRGAKGLQMVQFEGPMHRNPFVLSSFEVGWIPLSCYWPSGGIKNCPSLYGHMSLVHWCLNLWMTEHQMELITSFKWSLPTDGDFQSLHQLCPKWIQYCTESLCKWCAHGLVIFAPVF